MKALLQSLGFLLAGLLLVLPVVGADLGGGGGDNGGVWILPRSGSFGSGSGCGLVSHVVEPREVRRIENSEYGFTARVASDMGQATAVFSDASLTRIVPVSVAGTDVTVSPFVFEVMRRTAMSRVQLLLVDDQRRGYVIDIVRTAAGFELRLY